MRPVEILPKPPAQDPQYRYQSAIESNVKPSDLVNRALDATVTLTTRELLATSSEVRKHVKDLVTSKKVFANAVEVCEATSHTESPASALYVDLVKYDDSSSAATCLPLRVIFPMFAPEVEPECVLDGGAQMVIMRKDVWKKLGAPIIASRATPLESANNHTTMTLGLVENHPVKLGPVTIYLQIQVVNDAPFEVLLGRPFFDILCCSEISSSGGNHEILVKDPKDGTPYVFPTQPRLHRTPKLSTVPAVNFR
jgi:hypothetical protein